MSVKPIMRPRAFSRFDALKRLPSEVCCPTDWAKNSSDIRLSLVPMLCPIAHSRCQDITMLDSCAKASEAPTPPTNHHILPLRPVDRSSTMRPKSHIGNSENAEARICHLNMRPNRKRPCSSINSVQIHLSTLTLLCICKRYERTFCADSTIC